MEESQLLESSFDSLDSKLIKTARTPFKPSKIIATQEKLRTSNTFLEGEKQRAAK
jgi:hypothetical protein